MIILYFIIVITLMLLIVIGEVRWYLNSNYYGNISMTNESSIVIGSDRYNENGNVISLYQMNLLGKVYNEYIVNNYYGVNTVYGGIVSVLSNDVISIDLQTGNIIKKYFNNDDYDYIDNVDGNIILRKDNDFYKVGDNNKLEDTTYEYKEKVISFYNNTSNYSIAPSVRYGKLDETTESKKKKISLINYDKK